MSKVICDICGTVYQDTADSCPICGCSKDYSVEDLDDAFLEEEDAATKTRGGRFSSANQQRNREIFDYDAVNPEDLDDDEDEDEEEEDSYDEEEYENKPRSNTFLVIILTILIFLLLAATGFIFLRYFLPNMIGEETVPTTVATVPTETQTEETTEPTIPCQSLFVANDSAAELCKEGQQWLLHVKVLPEDTTDTLTYVSADESVVTVTDGGRITVVGEGQTTIHISCGSQQIEYPITVDYSLAVEETTVPETIPEMEVDPDAEDGGEETAEAAEATEASTAPANVTLKLGKSDISLGVGIQYTMPLSCDLKPEDIEWSIEHSYIAKVDEHGTITTLCAGTTAVIAKYGDQEVQCIIRVKNW